MAKTWQYFGPKSTVYSRAIIQSKVDLELSTLRNLQRRVIGKSCKNFQWKTDLVQILPGRPSDFVSYLVGSQLCSWHNFKC